MYILSPDEEKKTIFDQILIMDIFISWSKELSKDLAQVLSNWFPMVIQAVKPYFSPNDIEKGAKWNADISNGLKNCKVGIICVTHENQNSPWIMFEAGALSKNLDEARVVPILFDIKPTDITGPLIHFQAAVFSKDEIKKVVDMLNNGLGESKLQASVIDRSFEIFWPHLEKDVSDILQNAIALPNQVNQRPDRELLEEILSLTRVLKTKEADDFDQPDIATYSEIVNFYVESSDYFSDLRHTGLFDLYLELRENLRLLIHQTFINDPEVRKSLIKKIENVKIDKNLTSVRFGNSSRRGRGFTDEDLKDLEDV
ncbi:TIR domain protein [compost metagenome]